MFRVVWRMKSEKIGEFESLNLGRPLPDNGIFRDIEFVGEPSLVFPDSVQTLRAETLALAPSTIIDPIMDLAAYGQSFVDTREQAELLRARLDHQDDIAWAAIQPPLERPVIFSERKLDAARAELSLRRDTTPDFSQKQRYLESAPNGIDARYAWTQPGGKGESVRIIDIEDGWNFRHEDLLQSAGGVVFGRNTVHDHGTAVLGTYSGDHNGIGIKGIAPDAIASAASASWDGDGEKWNAAASIYAAAQRLRPGDIILLEMHAPGPNASGQGQDGFVPVEFWQSEWAAIRFAVERGIHVVEAAGNGGVNLDEPVYAAEINHGNKDSGAILVGAGASENSGAARSPLWFTNFGGRVDVQGWGEDIVTCGGLSSSHYSDLWFDQDQKRCYTQTFGGTSGASPIVVGCIAAIVGVRRAAGKPELTPAQMRRLLIDTGSAQNGSNHIGPLPNLRAALAH